MSNEDILRLAIFLLALLLIATWEHLAPRRPLNFSRPIRWISNLGLGLINQLLLRVFFPVLMVALAVQVQDLQWGLFNLIALPPLLAIGLCLLLLDLAIYLQHRVFHRLEWLWRFHQVHHSDLDFDVTTAVRFHPVEMLLSMLIKMVVIVALGAAPLAVLIFEVVLSLTALFNHGNISIPLKLDRILRWGLVTPDMHRIHHSAKVEETNSNYGFNLPWWDRLFNTYRAQPENGQLEMTVGLDEYRDEQQLRLPQLLEQPFRKR